MPCEQSKDMTEENVDLHIKYVGQHIILASMLCRVLSKIEGQESYYICEFGQDIDEWWEKHKKWDEEKIK